MKVLNDLFMDELADMYDAEKRIVKALPKMAKAANDPELQEAFTAHLKETEGHVQKLEKIFAAFGEKPKGKKCEGTVGILEEGESMMTEFKDSPALDAALISAAQKVEHYEISSYGALLAWAEILGNEESVELFEAILDEEEAADEKLTELSEKCNAEATGEGDSEDIEAMAGTKVKSHK